MNLFKRIIDYPSQRVKIFDLDFFKPWWDIFYKQKTLILSIVLFTFIDKITLSLFPIAIGWIIESKSYFYLLSIMSFYIAMCVISLFTYHPFLSKFFTQTQDNFRYNAYRHLLLMDPISHVQQPSGIIIGKIQRTSIAYLDMADNVVDEIVPMLIETGTVIITMMFVNFVLGAIVGISIFLITIIYALISRHVTSVIEAETNKKDDSVNQISAESLSQFYYIRASFTTDAIKDKLYSENLSIMQLQTSAWMTYKLIRECFVIFYFCLLIGIIAYLIHMIKSGDISFVFATTLVVMFLRGTKSIFSLDKRLKMILKSYRRIKDFYSFIEEFGDQSFPVLDTDFDRFVILEGDKYNIDFKNVTFGYFNQPFIFQDNSLNISIDKSEINKLYGIIGPSGIGKTTLVSILGGQIKPEKGLVKINGVDIYSVDDAVRRKLIALQGQIATSLRGSLRYNLTFGLPDDVRYSDQVLIGILESVGLWALFEAKDGLKTEIGESGLNLSGGQRQRLNFANLYLRALYYKPILILIDEPTSSLDEVSERAITAMISELAGQSLTLVIAHRLKTLENAKKILDMSLMEKSSELIFYNPNELLQYSEYYRQLLEGAQDIES
jgi:ABC-type multidrug transport system fused ATPase/permease subunit